jgi:hypothetical protein
VLIFSFSLFLFGFFALPCFFFLDALLQLLVLFAREKRKEKKEECNLHFYLHRLDYFYKYEI